jgi:hypothetical protein
MEFPPEYVAIQVPDGVMIDSRSVERTEPGSVRSLEKLHFAFVFPCGLQGAEGPQVPALSGSGVRFFVSTAGTARISAYES